MDPHKRSATIEVMAARRPSWAAAGMAPTWPGSRRCCRPCAAGWSGPGRSRAARASAGTSQRLLADGEQVVDVPPKLSARARVLPPARAAKPTPPTPFRGVVATRMAGLRPVIDDEQLALLRILADRRRSLGEDHTRMISQLHHLLLELIRAGRRRTSRLPRPGPAGHRSDPRRRRQGPPPGRRGAHQRPRAHLQAQEGRRQGATRPAEGDWQHACPVSTASVPPAQRGCWSRSVTSRGSPPRPLRLLERHRPDRRFSGDEVRHRLSRAGNRQINRALHIMAIAQLHRAASRTASTARCCGRSSMEAMSCFEAQAVRHRLPPMVVDARRQSTGPGGQVGGLDSSAAGSHPQPTLRIGHFPDPSLRSGRLQWAGPPSLWILSVGYAHGPDDLAILVARREAAPLAAEGLDEEKSASALGG